MRLGKVAANEAAATVSVESRAADDGVGWEIEARSVIIATGESLLDASFRSVFKRSTVSTVIHDVEAEINKFQLVQEWHSAVKQIQVMERESLDLVPESLLGLRMSAGALDRQSSNASFIVMKMFSCSSSA
jgi:hypothetical protein